MNAGEMPAFLLPHLPIVYLCGNFNNMRMEMLKADAGIQSSLPLMEEFYTIQGEGFFSGTAAYFVRLGGCDVGCHWCDVKESWDPSVHPLVSIEEIAVRAASHAGVVVITGGEPLMYNLDSLTTHLRQLGARTHIETSGAYELSGIWNWICLSPKKNKLPVESVYDNAHELKVVIYNKHDLIFAEEQAALVNPNAHLYLQAEWSRRDIMTPIIVDYVMNNPKWRIGLQTHKYLNIP